MMADNPFSEAQSWRNRAKLARAKAKNDPANRQAIAAIIAEAYERVAEQIEQRSRDAEESKLTPCPPGTKG